MKLLEEIIETLSSKDGSLTNALLKTKVFLHKIGHKELTEWVNKELNGYTQDDTIPEYRIFPAKVLVNAANIAYQVNSHPIPLGHLDEELKNSFTTMKISQSLATLEAMASGDGDKLTTPIVMEANGILGKGLERSYQIQQAWKETPKANLAQIFIQVKSRLLDFMLELKEQFGDVISEEDIREKSSAIDTPQLFNHTIFGDNATIIVGNDNKQKVINNIVKGDFNTLTKELKQQGVTELDISELKEAIGKDKKTAEITDKKFGPSVKKWLQSMLCKAVDASWQIELNVAGGLLVEALKKYYGWLS